MVLLRSLLYLTAIFFSNYTFATDTNVVAEQSPAPVETRTPTPVANSTSSSEPATTSLAGSAQNQNVNSAMGTSDLVNLECNLLTSEYTQNLKVSCNKLKASASTCSGRYDTAAPICNTESNPNLLSTISQVQALMGVAQGLMDSCNNFGKAMNIAKMGMAAYSLACGTVQKACDISCSTSSADMTTFETNSKSAQAALNACISKFSTNPETMDIAAGCKQELGYINTNLDPKVTADKKIPGVTVAAKSKACKIDMTTLLGMAVINLGSLAQSKAMSDQCEKDTKSDTAAAAVDCTKEENKTKTECLNKSTVVDCGLTANADKPICICKANPRVTGCEGISTALATNSTMSTGGDGTTSGRGANAKLTAAPGAATDKKFPADLSKTSKNDGSGIGGGGGGSTAGLSANSDVGSSDGTKLEKAENAGNANILSNESGGGGGGYRFGFGGSSGSKAQLRKLAGDNGFKGKLTAQDWSAQVTSNGGKSNFDKVKVRYIENRTSLLNR